jgi:hypothetical protein
MAELRAWNDLFAIKNITRRVKKFLGAVEIAVISFDYLALGGVSGDIDA